MDMLKIIYLSEYIDKEPSTPAFTSLLQRDYSCWEETEKIMGAKFAEDHWYQRIALEQERRFYDFRQGFRLGLSLALEGLHPENPGPFC